MNAEMSISRGRIENIEETFMYRDSCGNVHDNEERNILIWRWINVT